MNGHICPECGTDRGAASDDGRPGCRCAERAAQAVRAERSAEVAAAEDFHPLRIRPYVTLRGSETGGGDDGAVPPAYAEAGHEDAGLEDAGREGEREGPGDAAATVALGVVRGPESGCEAGSGPAEGATAVMGAVPQPGPPPGVGVDVGYGFGEEPPVSDRARRKGPALWLAVGAAAVAVVGTAAFAGGLFSGGEERDRALPDTVTSAPSASDDPDASASESGAGSPSASPSASASASAASGSASASSSASPSASPSRSATESASATPRSSKPAAPVSSAPPSTAQATGTVEQSPEPAAGAVLSRGDRGPEVAELQNRLAQVWLYNGPENGRYNDRVEDAVRTYQSYKGIQGDPSGTYGPNTRRALEAETREP